MNTFVRTVVAVASTLLGLSAGSDGHAQGLMPVPDIAGATVDSRAILISEFAWGGEIEYRYTITSPPSASGNIWLFKVDVSSEERGGSDAHIRRFPVQGGSATSSMEAEAELLQPFSGVNGSEVVLVKQLAPSGWDGGLTIQAFAQFSASDMSFSVASGTSVTGFVISVDRPPTIRQVSLTPHWILEVEDHSDVTADDLEGAFAIEQSIPVETFALGPLDIESGGRAHYERLLEDIRRAGFIGWVSDANLINELETSLWAARGHTLDDNNGLALAELQNMIMLTDAADPAVVRQEFRDLVLLNVDVLIELLPTFRNSFIPVFTASPETAELVRDDTFSLTMQHFNSALENNPPIANLRVLVRCVEGFPCANFDKLSPPGTGFRFDETGEVVFSYVGENVGHDLIEVVHNDFEVFEQLALIEVNWTADADMVVPAFVPPVILATEGDAIFVSDRTSNIGTIDVDVPTTTTYYISSTDPIDIDTATVLSERVVPPLSVGQFNDSIETQLVIPSGFTEEIHFLAACADSEDVVVESDETNNCSFSELTKEFDPVMVMDDLTVPLSIISVSGSDTAEGNFGQQSLFFEVSISAADPVNNITVSFATVDGTAVAGNDYEAVNDQVVFTAGTTELVQSIPVAVFGDFDVENHETFLVGLSNPSANAQIGTGNAIGTIVNDDLSTVTVGDVSALEGNSGTTPFSFPVMIDQSHPTEDVTVTLETIDGIALAGSDYHGSSPTVTFEAGTAVLLEYITVNVIGDIAIEPNEDFALSISSLSENAVTIDGAGVATILNDDSPPELDCSPATATPNALWPPNHKLVNVAIGGVLDSGGAPAAITVTAIEQDEPVNGLGDGDTSPDGFGVGTDTAQVRRERSGTSDGRIYVIAFNALDATTSATCTGSVVVGVPHDQGQGSVPIDSGARFDSTVP